MSGLCGQVTHVCGTCGKNFAEVSDLIQHVLAHKSSCHETAKERQICCMCGEGFTSSLDFKQHMKLHESSTFICEVCGIETDNSEHMLIHSGDSVNVANREEVITKAVNSSPCRSEVIGNTCQQVVTQSQEQSIKREAFKQNMKIHECSTFVCGIEADNSEHMVVHSGDSVNVANRDEVKTKAVKSSPCRSEVIGNTCQQVVIQSQDQVINREAQPVVFGKPYVTIEIASETMESISTSSDPYPYTCRICNKAFSKLSGLRKHKLVHQDNALFQCPTCGKRFKHNHVLKAHIRIHTGEKPYVCDICGRQFSVASNLTRHKTSHNPSRTYVCPICKKRFTSKHLLQQHLRCHNWIKRYHCHVCGYRTDYGSEFKKHEALHLVSNRKDSNPASSKAAETNPNAHVCDICNKSFSQQFGLTKHQRVHRDERPFKCPTCGKTFKHNHVLKTHMRIHTGEKPFKCETCGKCFNVATNLAKHKSCHSNERPHACSLCSKRFASPHLLQQHIKYHTTNRCYHCDVCGFISDNASHYASHLKNYCSGKSKTSKNKGRSQENDGVRQYACDHCDKKFRLEGTYRNHIVDKICQYRFVCHFCSVRFSSRKELKEHQAIHAEV